ncbi:reprolysin-like metallopeptidase [uncultured Nocardioides sp.]|uniref:reprolysin-like metallopeptidase n=1 Tax=uncultured Nocardioides sp. TaxID=198441 RepID=UPI0030F8C183
MTRSRLAVLAATALAAGLLPAMSTTGSAAAAPTTVRSASDADDIFSPLPGFDPGGDRVRVEAEDFAAVRIDLGAARAALTSAPKRAAARGSVFELPTPDGDAERFRVHRTTVMEPALAAAHPELRTYAGQSLDTPGRSVVLDVTPLGLHASVRGPGGDYLVDPAYDERGTREHLSYYAKDAATPVPDLLEQEEPREVAPRTAARSADDESGELVTRRTYRIAIANDPSYADYFGSENVLAEKVTLINRVNQVYNDDLGIRMLLVDGTPDLNFDTNAKAEGADGPCGSAPCFDPPVGDDPDADGYEPGMLEYCSPGALGRMRTVLGQVIGADAYDLGHLVLGVNGGGVAYLGVVGQDYSSGGCTGLPEPRGDFFAIDYVAHEIGHQFAGNHTFNGRKGACGGNIADASVEPGSGSSVMAYAGICGTDDLQPHTDPYFSQLTTEEVTSFVTERVRSVYEVQTVSLRGFDSPGDSIDISLGDETRTVTRGENYDRAGVEAAVEAVTGVDVRIARWGYDAYGDFTKAIANPGVPNTAGFQVIFNDELDPFGGGNGTRKNYTSLAVSGSEGVTAFVGETAKGGPASNRGDQIAVTANHKPVVDAGKNRVIPARTPFELSGSATDPDPGQNLTFMWEQDNTGLGTALTNNRKIFGPLFRVFSDNADVTDEAALLSPSPGQNSAGTSPKRSFPDLAQVMRGVTNAKTGACPTPRINTEEEEAAGEPILTDDELDCFSEFLPTRDYRGTGSDVGRKLVFRLTARDGFTEGGGSSYDDVKLRMKKKAGPFLVKSQSKGQSVKGGKKVRVAWDVARTRSLAKNVRVKLTTDGGETWSNVARKTRNDGAVRVKLPKVTTDDAWFKIEARGNIFYDINDEAFSIR